MSEGVADSRGAQVGRRESLHTHFSREIRFIELVELVGVTPGHENTPTAQQIRRGMIHPRNRRGREQLEPVLRVVRRIQTRLERRNARHAPPLRSHLRAINNQNISTGEKNHIPHDARHRHVLHRPRRVTRRRHHHPPTALRRRLDGIVPRAGAPANQNLRDLESILPGKW